MSEKIFMPQYVNSLNKDIPTDILWAISVFRVPHRFLCFRVVWYHCFNLIWPSLLVQALCGQSLSQVIFYSVSDNIKEQRERCLEIDMIPNIMYTLLDTIFHE